ncbi:MAG: hypothetical protein ACJ8F1_04720 [Polyangia bacterium]
MKGVTIGLLAIAAWLAGAVAADRQARAEPTADDKTLATMLFQQGRGLMADGRIPEACPKLEESQRLVPAGGTILNLALCHEQDGRLARAWSEFNEALVVAKRDGRHDRELEAASHVSALEPRLSRLTIVVPPATRVEGLVVERDGHELGGGAWSTPIPVDGGEHVIRATALGREPFTTTVVIGKEADARTIEIPVLATPVIVVVSPTRAPAPDGTPPMTASTARYLRVGGVATAGAGVLLLSGAGYALAMALSAKDASNPHCFTDGCDASGIQSRKDAVSRGDAATFLGIGGAVLVAAGATVYYFGRRSGSPQPETRVSARLVVGAAPGAVVTAIAGGF